MPDSRIDNGDPSSFWRRATRGFRSRNYRLFFTGQLFSMSGVWMQRIAVPWLAYRLTDSPWVLGVITFFALFPSFLCAPFAGALADQQDRRKILLKTQAMGLAQAAVLAWLAREGHIDISLLILLTVLGSLVAGFEMPTQQAFVVDLAENRNDFSNLIALNSGMFNLARLIGPSIAGILIAVYGEWVCFAVNAASYLVSWLAIWKIDRVSRASPPDTSPILARIRDGFSYAVTQPALRLCLAYVCLINFFSFPFMVLLPVFAKEALGGGPRLFGALSACQAVGALCGSLLLASRSEIRGLPALNFGAGIAGGIVLAILSLIRDPWLAAGATVLAGMGIILPWAVTATLIQSLVDDRQRGRIMSIYTMCFMGVAPVTSLIAGRAAETFGAPLTIGVGGVFFAAISLIFLSGIPLLNAAIRDATRVNADRSQEFERR